MRSFETWDTICSICGLIDFGGASPGRQPAAVSNKSVTLTIMIRLAHGNSKLGHGRLQSPCLGVGAGSWRHYSRAVPELYGYELGNAGLLHGHPIKRLRCFHGSL